MAHPIFQQRMQLRLYTAVMRMMTRKQTARRMAAAVALWSATMVAAVAQGRTATQAHTPLQQALGAMGPDAFVCELTVTSPAIAKNQLGASGKVAVAIHGTRGWQECRRAGSACRVLLFLPGFDGSPQITYLGPTFALREALDDAVAKDKLPPLVVVVPDPRTVLGGSFYTDSAVNGHWATFLLDELLPGVEAALGIPDGAHRRWVAGHSMGGFGTLHLALLRPGHWQGAVAISPVASTHFAEGARLRAAAAARHARPDHLQTLLAKPTTARFSERLFWAMSAAWTSSARATRWQDALAPGAEPALAADARKDWLRLDPSSQIQRDDSACRLPHVVLTVGSKDSIIPAAEVEAVAKAFRDRCGDRMRLSLVVHDGNHGNRVRQDLLVGLAALALPAPKKR